MRSFSVKHTKSTSEDAMNFAPCFCSASNYANSIFFSGIALAMSILFCLYALSLINIISIIITLPIIINVLLLLKSCGSAKTVLCF